MAKHPAPKDVVADFLTRNAKVSRGGRVCQTCLLKNRAIIEEAARLFNAERASGRTTVAWPSFVKHVLKREYGYELDFRSLLSHLEQHTDVEVAR